MSQLIYLTKQNIEFFTFKEFLIFQINSADEKQKLADSYQNLCLCSSYNTKSKTLSKYISIFCRKNTCYSQVGMADGNKIWPCRVDHFLLNGKAK